MREYGIVYLKFEPHTKLFFDSFAIHSVRRQINYWRISIQVVGTALYYLLQCLKRLRMVIRKL